MQTSCYTRPRRKGGQERTACCPPACWEGLLCAWHGHRLWWPGWRPPTSPRRLKALGPPCGICCQGAGHEAGAWPSVHQACLQSCSTFLGPGDALPNQTNSTEEVARSPLALPERPPPATFCWLSCYTERGGGPEWGHFVQNSKKAIHCAHCFHTQYYLLQ